MSTFDAEFVRSTINSERRSVGRLIKGQARAEREEVGKMREAARSILHKARRRYAALHRLEETIDQVDAGLDVIHAAERHAETCPCAHELDAALVAWKESNRT